MTSSPVQPRPALRAAALTPWITRQAVLTALFFLVPFSIGMVYLLAFYPGILSYDSIFQWDQAARFDFNNWHPAYHTLLVWLLTRIRYSPAIVALFQVAVFSAVLAYGLQTLQRAGVPVILLLLLAAGIPALPLNGMMLVTLWKDVLFGAAVLLLTVYVYKITLSQGAWLAQRWHLVYLGLTLANVTLLRHNGFPVAFGTLLLVWLVFPYRKAALQALALSLVWIGVVVGPLYGLIRVDRDYSQPSEVVVLPPIAAHVQAGAAFTQAETAFLDGIHPLQGGWPYDCYDATVLFYNGTSFKPLSEHPGEAARLFARLSLAAPGVTARHFLCMSSFVWQLKQSPGVLLETVYTQNQDLSPYPDWQVYAPYFTPRSKLPWLRERLVNLLHDLEAWDPDRIAWRPAVYLYAFSLSAGLYALRKRTARCLLILSPAVIQSVVIALTTQMQAIRYQYPVYLSALLFTLPLLYLAVRQPASEKTVSSAVTVP